MVASFVGISVLKRGSKWGVKGRVLEISVSLLSSDVNKNGYDTARGMQKLKML
jgi:hypothetical protein